jgi:hypothetical protein
MRLNAVPPSIVTPPEARSEVSGVAGTRAIGAHASGSAIVMPARPAAEGAPPAQVQEPAGERRQLERRSEDRRKRQLPVLLDMRVGPRRTNRRRADDETPPSIDIKA